MVVFSSHCGYGSSSSAFLLGHSGYSSMNRTGTFSSPSDYLNGQEHMTRLFKTAQQYAAILADCRRLMPPWFSSCRILRLENGVLSIGAPNQTLAARVRQNTGMLLQGLRNRGWEISQVRLKVSLGQRPAGPSKPTAKPRQFSEKARASFEALYRKLEESNSPSDLRNSLKRLLRHR